MTHPFIPRQQRHGPTLQSSIPRMQIPPSYILQSGIIAPRSDRPLELVFSDVNEPGFDDPVFHLLLDQHGLAEELTAFDSQVALSFPY